MLVLVVILGSGDDAFFLADFSLCISITNGNIKEIQKLLPCGHKRIKVVPLAKLFVFFSDQSTYSTVGSCMLDICFTKGKAIHLSKKQGF